MLFTNATFIGIDPTAGEKPFAYAAIDSQKKLMALGSAPIQEILAFVVGQQEAIVAICSPRQPNIGLMADDKVRDNLQPIPNPGRWVDFRVVDYLLRQKNIRIPQTRSESKMCPNWMQWGFQLYSRLAEFGFQQFPNKNSKRQYLEVYPHASFTILLGQIPLQKRTLVGRIQRQLILYEKDMDIPDPMLIFEEVTRHRILQGIIPYDELFTIGELDALVAAYTAWLAGRDQDEVTLIGDPKEGQVVLPSKVLKESYSLKSS